VVLLPTVRRGTTAKVSSLEPEGRHCPFKPTLLGIILNHFHPFKPTLLGLILNHFRPFKPTLLGLILNHFHPFKPTLLGIILNHFHPFKPTLLGLILNHFHPFSGSFAKLRKATISFIMSVRASVRTEQLDSHWTDFHEILYLRIFRKSVEKIQISLQ
jgi:hypothetical protein